MTNQLTCPLAGLPGRWSGDKGMDIAPEPDGTEHNPFSETIVFSDISDVTNAESQTLLFVHYHQLVTRKSDGEVFHNQTGYWMWDSAAQTIMHSLQIPRSVGLIAAGTCTETDKGLVFDVSATLGDADWGIVQSPFMRDNASTKEFRQTLTLSDDSLAYQQTTIVDIYDKIFDHTDENVLQRV